MMGLRGAALGGPVRLTVAAGLCTLAVACSLAPLFTTFAWFTYSLFTVLVVVGTLLIARLAGVPEGLVPLVGLLALVFFLTGVFADGTALFVVLPGHDALVHTQELLTAARTDIRELATPAPPRETLLLLVCGGVGVLALLDDLLSVTWRQPALVGLPIVLVVSLCSALSSGGIGWLPFALATLGYLGLLMAEGRTRLLRWGRPFTDDDDDSWRPERNRSAPLGASGRRIGATALGLALVLPVAFPFVTGGGLSSLTAGGGGIGNGGGGRSGQVINPITTLKGQLTEDRPTQLLQVQTSDPDPYYLRLTTLDQFNVNRGWSQGTLSAPDSAQVSRGMPAAGYGANVPLQQVTSRITVTGLGDSQYLPAYLAPTKVSVDGDWRYDSSSGTIFSTRTNARDVTYTETSVTLARSDALTSVLAGVTADQQGADAGPGVQELAAPADPAIQRIVNRIEQGKTTPYERTLALWRYFRAPGSGFIYTLSTKPGSSGDDLLDFLTNKEGYCEQYASAMAIMARYAGLPARVAIGFTKGVQEGSTWSVGTGDAHAWVEVWFAGIGWVPWDPTPLGGAGRATSLPYATTSDQSVTGPGGTGATGTGADGAGGTGAAGRSGSLSSKLAAQAAEDARRATQAGIVPDLGTPVTPPPPDRTRWWVAGLLLLLVALLVVPLGRLGQWQRRRRRTQGSDGRAAAYAGWAEVLASAQDVGLRVDDSESLRATGVRLAGSGGLDDPAAAALARLTRSVERAAYARDAPAVDGLAGDVRLIRTGLLDSVGRAGRLRAVLAPRSTLADLGRVAGRGLGSALDAVDAVPRAAVRLFSRRPPRTT